MPKISKQRLSQILAWKRLHPEAAKAISRRFTEKLRITVLSHYGGKCVCCGFDDLAKKVRGRSFLQIDHVNGGGRAHQISIGRSNFYNWLKRNKYPSGFRVLCGACNASMEPGELICEFHKWRVTKVSQD